MKKLIIYMLMAMILIVSASAIVVTRTAPPDMPQNVSAFTSDVSGDLTDTQTYYYWVIGTVHGWTYHSSPSEVVSATANASGSIFLNWSAASGANRYRIYRSPVPWCANITQNHGAVLDRDKHCMSLRNQNLYYTNTWTTADTFLTDIGSTTERDSGAGSYREAVNHEFTNKERGTLFIQGQGDGYGFSRMLNEMKVQGYTNCEQLYGFENSSRIIECWDDINIKGNFTDKNFDLIVHGMVTLGGSSVSGESIQFGERHPTNTDYCWGDWTIRVANQFGRQELNGVLTKYFTGYCGKFLRDLRGTYWQDIGAPSSMYSQTGSFNVYDNTKLQDVTIKGHWQQMMLMGTSGIDFLRVYFMQNNRGLNINADQSANSFDQVYLRNNQMDTTGKGGRLVGATFIWPSSHRYYIVNDTVRTCIDCNFPAGHGLPGTGSMYKDRNCSMEIKYTMELLLTDNEGIPINGVNVTIVDNQGNTFLNTSGSDGTIQTQELYEAVYRRVGYVVNGVFNETVPHNPHRMTLEHGSYPKKEFLFNITQPTDWAINMEANYPWSYNGTLLLKGDGTIIVRQCT